MVRYSVAGAYTSPSVVRSIICTMSGEKTTPSTVKTTPEMSVIVIEVCEASLTFSLLPAPKYCEITTLAPLESPEKSPMSIFVMGATLPTAEYSPAVPF